jgi:HK97 family phage prohead protease
MELKRKIFESKVQDVNESEGLVTVYANAFNVIDSDMDRTIKGCFAKTLQESKRVKWLNSHNRWNVSADLMGAALLPGSKEDDFGLLSVQKANMQKQVCKDMISDYLLFKELGRTLEHSIGYEVIKYDSEMIPQFDEAGTQTGEIEIRNLREVKVWEVSTVIFGANSDTPLVDLKSEKGLNETIDILERILSMKYSDERKTLAEKLMKDIKALVAGEPLDGIRTQGNYEPLSKFMKLIKF